MRYNLPIILTHELSFAVEYKWSKCGICVNTKTNNRIIETKKDRCKGYYINGKFKSTSSLRKQARKIEKQKTPW